MLLMFGLDSSSGLKRPDFFWLSALLALGAVMSAPPAHAQGSTMMAPPPARQQAELPRLALQIASQRVVAEVAADDASRSKGLMFRERLAPNHGMLFVFPEATQTCFWMKNTPLPLTVAFIDASGTITNLADMQPLSLESHCALAPALYALEMEQGWFVRNGIRPGERVQGLPRVPARTLR